MKRLPVFLALLLCLIAPPAFSAATVSLAWDPSPDADVNAYTLYVGGASGNYTNTVRMGNVTNCTYSAMVPGGHYWFIVTASNIGGAESLPSNEIDYLVPVPKPAKPANLYFTGVTIQSSPNLQTWTKVADVSLEATNTAAFYRLQVSPSAVTPAPAGLRSASVNSAPLVSPKSPFQGMRKASKKVQTTPRPAPPRPY